MVHGAPSDAIYTHVSDLTFGLSFCPLLKRASALAGQFGFTLIVLQTFRHGRSGWIFVAISLHFLIDFASGHEGQILESSGRKSCGTLTRTI